MKRKWNGSNWIRPQKREQIYRRDGYRCVYCLRDLAGVDAWDRQLDHLLPIGQGGTNDATNLVTCCSTCNYTKGAQYWCDFVSWNTNALERVWAHVSLPLDK